MSIIDTGERKSVRVAVIGGGVFGCTAAITLAEAGFDVSLYEKGPDIMIAASAINQYRVHKGYHYPRSSETIESCNGASILFEKEYREAIISEHRHYYCIAKEGSLVDRDQYLAVLDRYRLPYTIEQPPHVNPAAVQLSVRVEENLYDPLVLKRLLKERLKKYGVSVHLNTPVTVDDLSDYDFVVVATYAAINDTLGPRTEVQRPYQFEVCEKIVVEIPDSQKGVSTVVMDGPFMTFDPYGKTGYAVMGHVEHAILARNVGLYPEIPEEIAPYLNSGVIENPPVTKAELFLESAAYFMPALKGVRHVGSMFTVRTVLPNVDDTDTRPTLVNAIDERVVTIYSGKVGNSVRAARDVLNLIENRMT